MLEEEATLQGAVAGSVVLLGGQAGALAGVRVGLRGGGGKG